MTEQYDPTFEELWQKIEPGYKIVPKRVERFDLSAKLFVSPMEYETVPFVVSDTPPSDDLVRKMFFDFVQGEFGSGSGRGSCPPHNISLNQITLSGEDVAISYLKQSEDLVYGGYLDTFLATNAEIKGTDRIYSILCDPIIGNKENRKYLSSDSFNRIIATLNKLQVRIQFILPSFPFKDQSVFRTGEPPEHIDMGEIALIIRLHTLALAMYQVHLDGVDWILATDGKVYSKILGVEESKVSEYQSKLKRYRDYLGIQRSVHIIDLKEMTQRIVSKNQDNKVFDMTKEAIKDILTKRVCYENEKAIETLRVLVRGMKWNVNIQDLTRELAWEDLWSVMNSETGEDLPANLRKVWNDITEFVAIHAIDYAAFNLTMKYYEVYRNLLPKSIRATVHPKKDQVAIPNSGEVYPWNGVAVRTRNGNGVQFESIPLYTLLKRARTATSYCAQGDDLPLFYEINERSL